MTTPATSCGRYMRFIMRANGQVFVLENVDRFGKSPEFQLLLSKVDHGLLTDYDSTTTGSTLLTTA